ncbi:MAG TPA: PorV/PorQ family protein, partial [Elusimicrobiota bacterium]|nr:PorV/PorQ family protein [Elusimicrobiota bacterium]
MRSFTEGAMNSERRPIAEIVQGGLKTVLAAAFLAAVAAGPRVWAAGGQGGAPGQFLSWGAGARSMGMGKAFTAVADDASATYWNPAAMVQMERKELQAMHVSLFEDTSFDFVSYVHPTARAGTLGLNFTRLVSGGFEKIAITLDPTSQEIVKLQKLGDFSDINQAYGISYGRQFVENMSIGVTGKVINHTIDDFRQNFFSLDAAFFAKELIPHYRLALMAQNVVTQVSGETDDKLPLTLRVGHGLGLRRVHQQ